MTIRFVENSYYFVGASEVYKALMSSGAPGDPKLNLWESEHRQFKTNYETCMNVWQDMVKVADQVMNE